MSDPKTWTTYKRVDGDDIGGEYAWVDGLEWFDAEDEQTELIEEVWVLQSTRTITVGPLCDKCGDEPATHWGLCEKHAREDDPESFAIIDAALGEGERSDPEEYRPCANCGIIRDEHGDVCREEDLFGDLEYEVLPSPNPEYEPGEFEEPTHD